MTVVIDIPSNSPRGFGRSTQPKPSVELTSNQDFLATALGNPQRFHYSGSSQLWIVNDSDCDYPRYGSPGVSLGFQAIHQAFAAHVPLSLRPDTLWYMIVHEVAEHIRQNSGRYATLFTDTPETKQTIKVRDDSLTYEGPSDWGRTINLFRDPLHTRLAGGTAELFLPRFSTTTIVDETALLVALMDAASPYYDYVVETRCGIPQIRLEGEAADWENLYRSTESLARTFDGLSDYFGSLLSVLRTIADTAAGATPDQHFWRSIYKYQSMSGGATANGWITAFFAFIQTPDGPQPKDDFEWGSAWGGFRLNQFPAHVSRVPFIWDYYGTNYEMAFAAGVTNVDFTDGFLTPKLGFAVIEI